MKTIVFICTGNTCRSPMAETLFRARGGEEKTHLKAKSAGVFTRDAMPASLNAMRAVERLGGDLSQHLSRQIDEKMVKEAAYLVCMTAAHYDAIVERFPHAKDKIWLLAAQDVDDPFGGNLKVYEDTAAQINDAVKALIEKLAA